MRFESKEVRVPGTSEDHRVDGAVKRRVADFLELRSKRLEPRQTVAFGRGKAVDAGCRVVHDAFADFEFVTSRRRYILVPSLFPEQADDGGASAIEIQTMLLQNRCGETLSLSVSIAIDPNSDAS